MKILAVDTSCDDSCAAILDTATWRLLADVVHSHVDHMAKFGGIVPEVASREHLKGLPLAVHEAMTRAGLQWSEIDHLAVTNRPGLIGALLVGVAYVKGLAYALGKPFSALNHIEGHLFSPKLVETEGGAAPAFPWVSLVVSGGHTELFHVRGLNDVTWLGGTLDDAAGEAFDKVGKLMEMPYPAGPLIDRWVKEKATDADRKRFAFPRARLEGHRFSFSGLKTAVSLQVQKLRTAGGGKLSEADKLAVAASAQEAIVDALVDKTRKAARELGVTQIVVAGGVACNGRLRERLPEAHFPLPRHCTDNAAMIALLAGLHERAGTLEAAPLSTSAKPHAELGTD